MSYYGWLTALHSYLFPFLFEDFTFRLLDIRRGVLGSSIFSYVLPVTLNAHGWMFYVEAVDTLTLVAITKYQL